jgi:4-hydroxy-tetrahydrodipicolinate reductase
MADFREGTMGVGIAGAGGRMGRMLIQAVLGTPGLTLSVGSVRPGSNLAGRDLGLLAGLEPSSSFADSDPAALFSRSDVVIDFTNPSSTRTHLDLAQRHGVGLVIGTTGLSDGDQAAVNAAGRSIAIVQAANMSLGVVLLQSLVQQVTATLGPDWDVEIVEMHHRHKVDAPSGTALALGRAAAAGRDVALADVRQSVRDGHTGPRPPGQIGFATLRGGDVVGEHTVIVAGVGERLELTHRATDRGIFARGAVRAAAWLKDRPPGLYGMTDVLGLA